MELRELEANAVLRGQAAVDRDRLILEAHAASVPVVRIAAAAQMSRMQVHRIISAARQETNVGVDE